MKIKEVIRLSSFAIITVGLVFCLWSCSSSEGEEQMEAQPTEQAAEPPAQDSANAAQDDTIQITEVEPQTPTAEPAPEPAPIPAATAQMPPPSSDKVVRFVKATGAAVYDQPNGKKIGSLVKGDHVLVSVQGDWAITAEGQYIPAKSLSEKAIPRKFNKIDWRH